MRTLAISKDIMLKEKIYNAIQVKIKEDKRNRLQSYGRVHFTMKNGDRLTICYTGIAYKYYLTVMPKEGRSRSFPFNNLEEVATCIIKLSRGEI